MGKIVNKSCKACGREFSFITGSGKDRIYCGNKECIDLRKKERAKKRLERYPICSVDGCNNPANRVKYGLCESCYYRLRRNGTTYKRLPAYKHNSTGGYIKIYCPEHILSDSSGYIYEHRKIVYDSIGKGPHNCFWCEIKLEWQDIVIDHLNENKQDNNINNLVVSCNKCNRARGAMLPFIERMKENSFDVFIEYLNKYRKDINK